MRVIYCLVLISISWTMSAQSFYRNANIDVTAFGEFNADPWAGGLNSCQISTFDANLDGVKDLFIFDRNGGKISVYINTSSEPGTYNYRYTQE